MKINRQMGDKELLELLDIPSFRHMSKDKLIRFVSAMPEVNPEVAKKALEQFPDFASTMGEIAVHYKSIIEKCLEGSDADTTACLAACSAINDSILRELEKGDPAFEERERLIDKSIQVAQMMRDINEGNTRFRLRIVRIATAAFGFAIGALIVAIGGNASITLPEIRRAA